VTERTLAALGGADHAICSNGAMSVRLDDGQVLRDVFLPTGYPEAIVERLRAALPGAGFAVEFSVGVKAESGFGRRLPRGVALGPPVDDVLTLLPERGPVRKVMVFHDDFDDRIAELVAVIEGVIGEAIAPLADLHVQHSGLAFLEVGPSGSDKAVALAQVCELLGVERETVVAFGDDVNDIPMLVWAGTGVAMANAVERVRATADVVTASNDDDGVARYLDVLLARHE
jgi:hydroxymethylpyrimidine pyrophosphatase-like HAD family hydrolase